MIINGEFDVSLQPLETFAEGKGGATLGRMSIEKTFHGALKATGRGEMLNVMTAVDGSAGYVAIEQVEGVLSGRSGSFVLQHFGMMDGGSDRLILQVVPDSGAGELTGLSGTMKIKVKDGKHIYDFQFELPN